MNILLVYANEISEGCMQVGLAMISAVLKNAGHKVSLFDTSFFETGETQERELREKYLEHRKISNLDENYIKKDTGDIAEEFRKTVVKNKPELIAVSSTSTEFPFIKPFLKEIKKNFKIPILVGGVHATVAPGKVIEEDCVDMICLGEGEEAIVELSNIMDKGGDYTGVRNIWVKRGNKVFRNEVRPLIQNLDCLPLPDWELFDRRHFIRPFRGKVRRYGFFELGRGCPFSCTYCVNNYLHTLYKGKGKYRRIKSIERAIDEIEAFKNKFGLDHVQFVDDTFLTIGKEKLKRFTALYRKRIGATVFIMTRAETIDEETAGLLKEMGCVMAAIGIESGNEIFRESVYKRHLKNSTIVKAFRLLKENGIKTQSYNILGSPHETRKLIFDTIKLNRKVKPDQFTLKFLYPFEGTAIRKLCIDAGYIRESSHRDHRYFEGSLLKMPHISETELKGLRKTAILYVYLPYMLWPLIRIVEKTERESFVSGRLYTMLSKFVRV